MRTPCAIAVAVAVLSAPLVAQDKPVPKDSLRVRIPGCAKGYVFTAGPKTEDQTGRLDVPDGMHLRMTGPKHLMKEIKAHEGSMVEITGLMKKGQNNSGGIAIGGGVRITPGPASGGGRLPAYATASPNYIDVEGWRPVAGDCGSR